MSGAILHDAVIFDLDGTLVATDRFWVDAARTGARRAFEELGIDRAMPSSEEWMSVVGLPLALGFDNVFPDLTPAQRKRVLALCVEAEEEALRAGHAALLPGVRETLEELRARGLRLGIASNCGKGYLHTMLHELGLATWIHAARCLDSPRVTNKASMVHDLLEEFGTRSAVMVGDRSGDRDAAWENGIPHVHYARGFEPAGGAVEAEGQIDEMGLLVGVLERRAREIDALIDAMALAEGAPPRAVAVTGHSGSGKTFFARDLARRWSERGVAAAVVPFDAFLRAERPEVDLTRTAFVPGEHALDHVRAAFDVEELLERVLVPHARGEAVAFERDGVAVRAPKGSTLIVEGLFLLHPDLRARFDRVVHLEADERVLLRRIAGRDAWTRGSDGVLLVRRHHLPMQRAFDERFPPRSNGAFVVRADDALAPVLET